MGKESGLRIKNRPIKENKIAEIDCRESFSLNNNLEAI